MAYAKSIHSIKVHAILKCGYVMEDALLTKLLTKRPLSEFLATNNELSATVYYHSGGRYFRKCIEKKLSNEYKELTVQHGKEKNIISLISSSLYYWYWLLESDCYHVTKTDVLEFPCHPGVMKEDVTLIDLGRKLLFDLEKNAVVRNRHRKSGIIVQEVNYYVRKSKFQIDLIDMHLSKIYGFTPEETDFIINYDIKYRMGGAGDDEE